jgi:Na+/H+ antiporter NhaD/arsenite permease-like protein
MDLSQALLTAILLGALLIQARWPAYRLLVVTCGAAFAALASALLGVATAPVLLAQVPWDVLVILVGLGLLSELFVASRLFGLLALWASRWSRASPRRVLVLFAVGMYAVSGLVNNLTALLLVLPVLLILFKLLGVRQRYASWTLGVVLVSCNLGGAATPIGDFPAILLLGSGSMGFREYLVRAAPATWVGLAAVLVATMLVRPERGMERSPVAARLTVAVISSLYRRVQLDWRRFTPAAVALGGMLAAWIAVPPQVGVTPELICWLGAGLALLASPAFGERTVRRRVDVEATLFLLSLFVMVGAVSQSGMFGRVAQALGELPLSPAGQVGVFLVVAGVLTGLFSAGPSMAALLEVAQVLAERYPPHAIYVGLALSVCAGSSLFLTAATAGPLAQALTERARLTDPDGQPIRFGFLQFLPTGLVSFTLILSVALGYGLWNLQGA